MSAKVTAGSENCRQGNCCFTADRCYTASETLRSRSQLDWPAPCLMQTPQVQARRLVSNPLYSNTRRRRTTRTFDNISDPYQGGLPLAYNPWHLDQHTLTWRRTSSVSVSRCCRLPLTVNVHRFTKCNFEEGPYLLWPRRSWMTQNAAKSWRQLVKLGAYISACNAC